MLVNNMELDCIRSDHGFKAQSFDKHKCFSI